MFRFHNLLTRSRLHGLAVAAGLLATTASTLRTLPHQLAYFNELSGGPENGHMHLLGSALDWGQSLVEIDDWLTSNDSPHPVFLAYHGHVDPRQVGIADVLPMKSMSDGETICPGWYLISRNLLSGVSADGPETLGCSYRMGTCSYRINAEKMHAIRNSKCMGSLGYTIVVFQVPPAG